MNNTSPQPVPPPKRDDALWGQIVSGLVQVIIVIIKAVAGGPN
jgi:hypothetical protein